MDILTMLKQDRSYTLSQRCFYELIFELEKKLEEFKVMQDVESETIHDPEKRTAYLQELRDHFIGLVTVKVKALESEAAQTNREIISQAKYMYCVYIDESLLHEEWFGKDEWANFLIEYSEFGTRNAGDEIFKRIESLLKYMSSQNKVLAKLYLLMLGAGFRGRYRDRGYTQLSEIKNELYLFLKTSASYPIEQTKIFPQNYKCILSQQKIKLMPFLSKSQRKLLIGFVLFFIASIYVWEVGIEGIKRNADSVHDSLNLLLSKNK